MMILVAEGPRRVLSKKQQRKGTTVKKAVVAILVIVALLFVGMYFFNNDEVSEKEVEASFIQCWIYLKEKECFPNRWWLDKTPSKTAVLDSHDISSFLESKNRELLEIMARYRRINALTERIAERFSSFSPTLYVDGGYRAELFYQESGQEVCFIAQDQILKDGGSFPSPAWATVKNGPIFVFAYDWPHSIFAASIFHEMGHQLMRDTKLPATGYDRNYAEEEVLMHRLDVAVLDEATEGRYFNALDEIIADHRKGSDFVGAGRLVCRLTANDFCKLDLVVGAGNSGPLLSSMMLFRYKVDVGLRAIEKGISFEGGDAVDFYYWLKKTFGVQLNRGSHP